MNKPQKTKRFDLGQRKRVLVKIDRRKKGTCFDKRVFDPRGHGAHEDIWFHVERSK